MIASKSIIFMAEKTVRKYKIAYGLKKGKVYPSDAYAVCKLCSLLGKELSPKHSFVFIDEAQDISAGEYELLREINQNASFNIFGDLDQNVTPYRGVESWSAVFPDFEIFKLNRNYRNTNQIVEFVSKTLQTDMKPMGYDGEEVKELSARNLHSYFKNAKGLKAVICSDSDKEEYAKKSYFVVSEKGRLSRSKINLLTVYESKGLEFSSVAVADKNMTPKERYIAYTRALKELVIIK